MESRGRNKFKQFVVELTQDSFSGFFDYYFTRLVQFARTIAKSDLLAEEVVLDVFVKLWEKKESLNSINNIETYLFIAVRNTVLTTLKKEQKFHFDMLEDSHIQLASYNQLPENILIESEMLRAFNHVVAALPAKCKIIFKLIREDGLNRNEVAKILNISVKTVDNQVSIAVSKIAKQLNIDLSNPKNSIGLTSFLLTF